MPAPSTRSNPPESFVPARDRVVGRQVAVGFGLVSAVAIVMCVSLLFSVSRVSTVIGEMRQDEAAIRRSFDLASGIREQYIHIAHSIVVGDRSHLVHYGEWRERVVHTVEALQAEIPLQQRQRLEQIRRASSAMHERFEKELMPAAEAGKWEVVQRGHVEVEELAERAAADADSLARSAELRMADAHRRATLAAQVGLASGAACVLLVLGLSALYTMRLRAALFKPLRALTEGAKRFGSGQFERPIGKIGEGELQAVAEAFDRMADELARRERRVVETERMAAIGQLAAGVAHELNNPIGIIRGYLATMDPDGDKGALREEIEIIDEEAGHCQRIAEHLLTYARMHELSLERVHMKDFLEQSLRRFGESAALGGHELQLKAEPGELLADAPRLRQVLANLVTNAAQVSPPGASIEVSGKARARGGYEFVVCDRGPGVPEEDRRRIFEPFFSKRQGGSGLGLALCLGIVRAHGGSIMAEDRPGGGSCFRIRLPAKPPNTDEEVA